MEERLQKILARHGYGSRRSTETIIEEKRVQINGVIARLGDKADPALDSITVDQRPIPKEEPEKIYIALHKPKGVLSDVDPADPRPTVLDLVPVQGHLFAVGRLDLDSEGLMLLTNDGELANRLSHPRYGHEKEYRVQIAVRPEETQLETWRRGVVLPDGVKTAPAQVTVEGMAGKGTWLKVILREGRKRQIREVGRTIGLPVFRIIRVRIGSLLLGNLKLRDWRYLKPDEVRELRSGAEMNRAKTSGLRRRAGGAARPLTKPRSGPAGKSTERKSPLTSAGGGEGGRARGEGRGADRESYRPGRTQRGGTSRSGSGKRPGKPGSSR